MQFNSLIFITIFLPLSLAVWYFLLHKKQYSFAKVALFGFSLWFYAFFNLSYLAILLVSITLNYGISYLLNQTERWRRGIYYAGLIFNLGMLGYFKYADFFIENVNSIFRSDFPLTRILLPLGISFFTFRQIAYLTDRYKKEAEHYLLLDFACFISFFPQLVAGPIVYHSELVPQFLSITGFRFQAATFERGFHRFILGLGKKVLIADFLSKAVNHGFSIPTIYYLDSPSAFLIMILFAFELYIDFSAYSDMAIGVANMFGFTLPENFDSPYKSLSVGEFWRRWHITLSRFFRKYVYIPLGGNRRGKTIKYRNLLIVFVLSGLWHGADWTFVIWGALQGVAVIWEDIKPFRVKIKPLAWCQAFLFTVMSFTFFRSEDLNMAQIIFRQAFRFEVTGFIHELAGTIRVPENYVLIRYFEIAKPEMVPVVLMFSFLLIIVITVMVINGKQAALIVTKTSYPKRFIWVLAFIFVWSFISLSQVSEFMYFNF